MYMYDCVCIVIIGQLRMIHVHVGIYSDSIVIIYPLRRLNTYYKTTYTADCTHIRCTCTCTCRNNNKKYIQPTNIQANTI